MDCNCHEDDWEGHFGKLKFTGKLFRDKPSQQVTFSFIKTSGGGHTSQLTHLWLLVHFLPLGWPLLKYQWQSTRGLPAFDLKHTIVNHGKMTSPNFNTTFQLWSSGFESCQDCSGAYSSWRILRTFDGLKENTTYGALGKNPTTITSRDKAFSGTPLSWL